MFKKVVESLEKTSVRAALSQGKFFCPDCGAKAGTLPAEWGQVMECTSCGAKASLPEWVAKDGIVPGNVERPLTATRIRKEDDALGGTVWHIPAGGNHGFFMFFAVFWLGVTVLGSGGFLVAFLTGGKIEGDGPVWILIPFFALFYAVGFGILYVALRQKYMQHRLTVSGGRVTLASEMFGRKKEKSLEAGTIKTVEQKEFYRQNYKPVYGVEIKGTGGKIRFGSALSNDEKAWLVADIKEAIFGSNKAEPKASGKTELKMSVAGHSSVARKEVFSVAMPRPKKFAWVGGLVFMLMAMGFVCIGIFVIEGEPLPEKGEGAGYIFGLVFSLFTNGFRGIWLLLTSVFALIGIAVFVGSLRAIGQDKRIEGNSAEISIRTYKRGLVVKDKSFPRKAVADIRAFSVGSTNGTQMKRIELIVGNKAERITNWTNGEDADALVAEVREAMGL